MTSRVISIILETWKLKLPAPASPHSDTQRGWRFFACWCRREPKGVNAGLICDKLKLAPATLSFHLAHLSRVGLIRGRQEGRFIFYAADYAAMDALLAFLTDNCCQGAQCLPLSIASAAPAKRRRAASAR